MNDKAPRIALVLLGIAICALALNAVLKKQDDGAAHDEGANGATPAADAPLAASSRG